MYSEIVPFDDRPGGASRRGARPGSSCPAARPPCTRRGPPPSTPALFDLRRPGPGDLLRAPASWPRRWGAGRADRAPGSTAGPIFRVTQPGVLLARPRAGADGVDEPRRYRDRGAAGVRGHRLDRRRRRWRPWRIRRSGAVRGAVPPRGRRTPPRGVEVLKRFLYEGAVCCPDWTPRQRHRAGRRADPPPGRRWPRAVRSVGRRGLRGGRPARAPGHREAPHLRVRGQRAAPGGGGRPGRRDVRAATSGVP